MLPVAPRGSCCRFGRKAMLMWSYLQLGVMGTCTAFAPNYASYCVFRFAGGMALSGFGLSIACLGEGTRGQPSGLGWGQRNGNA